MRWYVLTLVFELQCPYGLWGNVPEWYTAVALSGEYIASLRAVEVMNDTEWYSSCQEYGILYKIENIKISADAAPNTVENIYVFYVNNTKLFKKLID